MITKYTVRHYPAAQVSYTYGNHPGHLVSLLALAAGIYPFEVRRD